MVVRVVLPTDAHSSAFGPRHGEPLVQFQLGLSERKAILRMLKSPAVFHLKYIYIINHEILNTLNPLENTLIVYKIYTMLDHVILHIFSPWQGLERSWSFFCYHSVSTRVRQ
jgi:hypothetical protein